jgi:hypothetical protein
MTCIIGSHNMTLAHHWCSSHHSIEEYFQYNSISSWYCAIKWFSYDEFTQYILLTIHVLAPTFTKKINIVMQMFIHMPNIAACIYCYSCLLFVFDLFLCFVNHSHIFYALLLHNGFFPFFFSCLY